ncbi:AAA family ATPase [Chloroflexi bacterium TSY]|nr:AAA family ATPase [Chloroflexi bacterium TSY]
MKLILLTGLPGTGKSTLAKALSDKIQVPVFSKDIIEAALLRCDVKTACNGGQPVSYAVYEILFALAEQQLSLRQSCIIDCVASHPTVRKQFQLTAKQHHAKWLVIECICSDEEIHKTRLTTRKRNIPGYRELDWYHLLKTKERYVQWEESRHIVDSVNLLNDNIDAVLSYISAK